MQPRPSLDSSPAAKSIELAAAASDTGGPRRQPPPDVNNHFTQRCTFSRWVGLRTCGSPLALKSRQEISARRLRSSCSWTLTVVVPEPARPVQPRLAEASAPTARTGALRGGCPRKQHHRRSGHAFAAIRLLLENDSTSPPGTGLPLTGGDPAFGHRRRPVTGWSSAENRRRAAGTHRYRRAVLKTPRWSSLPSLPRLTELFVEILAPRHGFYRTGISRVSAAEYQPGSAADHGTRSRLPHQNGRSSWRHAPSRSASRIRAARR